MKKILVIGVACLLLLPAVAQAGSVTKSAYGGSGGKVVTEVVSTPQVKPASKTFTSPPKATLPFTGADLTLVTVAGIALLGTGFGLRRLAHRSDS